MYKWIHYHSFNVTFVKIILVMPSRIKQRELSLTPNSKRLMLINSLINKVSINLNSPSIIIPSRMVVNLSSGVYRESWSTPKFALYCRWVIVRAHRLCRFNRSNTISWRQLGQGINQRGTASRDDGSRRPTTKLRVVVVVHGDLPRTWVP